jgi:hypothetical protein
LRIQNTFEYYVWNTEQVDNIEVLYFSRVSLTRMLITLLTYGSFIIKISVASTLDDSTTSVLITHECQRYMSSTAFGYVSLDDTCPPSDLDLCTSADDGYWKCSSNIAGGIFS